jgi:hypothetical protein
MDLFDYIDKDKMAFCNSYSSFNGPQRGLISCCGEEEGIIG